MLNIRLLTRKPYWTEPQRKNDAGSNQVPTAGGLRLLLVLTAISWCGYQLKTELEKRYWGVPDAKAEADRALEYLSRNEYEQARGVLKHSPDPTGRVT